MSPHSSIFIVCVFALVNLYVKQFRLEKRFNLHFKEPFKEEWCEEPKRKAHDESDDDKTKKNKALIGDSFQLKRSKVC